MQVSLRVRIAQPCVMTMTVTMMYLPDMQIILIEEPKTVYTIVETFHPAQGS